MSLSLLYLTYLTSLTHPLSSSYPFLALSALLGISSMNSLSRAHSNLVRVFLLSSLDQVRLENATGDFVDVKIEELEIEHVQEEAARLVIRVKDKRRVEIRLKDATYFDPELLYAVTHKGVARITPTIYNS
jgi:hypothetical protein